MTGKSKGQAAASPGGDAPSAVDKSASTTTMPAAAQASELEHFVRYFAALTPAEAQATLEEYSHPNGSGNSASTEWQSFVRHTWLPVVSVAYGNDWRENFSSDEVAAMLSLHRSLVQPKSPTTRPSGSSTGSARPFKYSSTKQQQFTTPLPPGVGGANVAAAAGRHLANRGFPTPVAVPMPSLMTGAGGAPGSASPESDTEELFETYPHEDTTNLNANATNAAPAAGSESADADGKRRRLRRKRAASPEEHTADGASPSSSAGGNGNGATSSAPSSSTTPSPPRQSTASSGISKSNIIPLSNKTVAAASGGSAAAKKKTSSPAVDTTNTQTTESNTAVSNASDNALSSEIMNRLLENISKLGLDTTSTAAATVPLAMTPTTGAAEAPADEQETISLAHSLTLIHDLTHRLNTGLRLHDEVTFFSSAAAPEEQAAKGGLDSKSTTANSSVPSTSSLSSDTMKTLHLLLGASLGDRMDLLGRTALHVAVASGQRQVVAALVAAGCDVNRELPLDPRILQKYALGFSSNTSINSSPGGAAFVAPSITTTNDATAPPSSEVEGQQKQHALPTAISDGVNVLATVMEPPSWPSKQGTYSIGDHPPDPSPASLMGSSPVHWAAALGDVISLETLLSAADVDVNARTIEDATPLHWAARGGHAAATAALCRAPGIDLDAADSYGRTALHIAAAHGHESVVQQLWARGACIDPVDGYDWRPLHYATRHGYATVASHLVIAGSQVQAFDPDGVTAGHLAAERGYVDILDKLLIAGYLPDAAAAPYAGSHGGTTALHLAASHGHLAAVQVLLRWSANPQALDSLGCTPLDLAVMAGHFHVAPALVQAGSGLSYPLEEDDDDEDDDEDVILEKLVLPSATAAAATTATTTDSTSNNNKNSRSSNGMEFIAQGVPPNVPCAALKSSLESQGLSVVSIDHAMYPGSVVPWSGVFAIAFAEGTDVPHHILLTDDDGKGIEGKISLTPAPARKNRRRQAAAVARRRSRLVSASSSASSKAASEGSSSTCPSLIDDDSTHGGRGGRGGSASGSENESESESEESDSDDDSGESIDDPPPPPPRLVSSMLWCLQLEDPLSHPGAESISPDECVYEEFGKAVSFTSCVAATGNTDVLEKLYAKALEMGINFSTELASHALLMSVRCGKASSVQWLIEEAGCGVNTCSDDGLLVQAAYRGHRDVVEILLKNRWDPAQQYHGSTALQEAAMCGHIDIAQVLLSTPQGRATVDIPCSVGYTALHHAAESGLIDLVNILVAAGASVHAVTNDGKTPAHLAAKQGHVAVLQALRKAGANLGALDNKKWSPLHCIARRGDLATFVLLHSQTVPLLTADSAAGLLTAAVRGGSPEMVGALLRTRTATPESCKAAGEMPVHAAAREGFLEPLAFLSEAGFDLTAPDEEGRTPLHHVPTGYGPGKGSPARHEAFVAVADVLLAAGCRADTPDSHSCTPLHIAAGCGSSDMLRTFMDLAENAINAADQLGWTPLFWAASEGHVFAVRMLLEGGADPTWKDCNQRIPLHFAAEGGHLACVNALLDAHIASKTTTQANAEDHNGQTAVQLAAYAHHIECVAAILDAAPSAPPYGAHPAGSLHSARDAEMKRRNALHLAASQGLDDIVDPLLECRRLHPGAKDAEGWAPLHFAAAGGYAPVVYLLVGTPGVDVDDAAADGDTPLHKASLGGHHECVAFLLDAGQAQVDSRNAAGSTPLYNASSQNHLQVMKLLLEGGAAPDAPTSSGCTPLYIAANNGWPDAVKLLIQHGAKVDLEATQGCTALHAAALNGQTKVICALLESGADIDAQSSNGSTPLHNAAANGHKAAVEALLLGSADTEVENTSGNTPLHMAAGKGWAEVVELLIDAGADLTVRNQKGYLAVQSAASGGFFDVVLKLVHAGAAWRQKGDADVVKLLSRKTTLRVSYVEGRLRLAEKERHRKLAKGEAIGGAGSGIGGGASGAGKEGKNGSAKGSSITSSSVSAAEDLKKAKAQADAVMAALLEEEQAEKAKADRAKAKKEAKKQKKAAQKQAETTQSAPPSQGDAKKLDQKGNAPAASTAANEQEEEEEDDSPLLDEDDIVALAVAEKQKERQLLAASKLEASSGRQKIANTTGAHATMSNGNGNGVSSHHHHHHHTMSFAEAQLRAKPLSAMRNGGGMISAGAAVAAKPAMPIRSASEGIASAPAMPVVRAASSASNNTINTNATQPVAVVPPPPPPPPPPGAPPLANMKPAGPYAAALAGKQPPPPVQSHQALVAAAPPAVAAPAPVPAVAAPATGALAASRQMPWGDASNSAPAIIQQQQRPRVPPPGFQQDAAPAPPPPPTTTANVVYQQQQHQPELNQLSQSGMAQAPILPPPPSHQHQMGPPQDGNFVPLFGGLDLPQQQQQQQMEQHQQQMNMQQRLVIEQQMTGGPLPIPNHHHSPLGLDWGLGGGGGGLNHPVGQYPLSSSMVDHNHGPPLFVTHHQQVLQSGPPPGGYVHQSLVGPPPPHQIGSYGAATGMMIGPVNGEAGALDSAGPAAEADGIDDVLRMQPWLLE